MIAVGHRQKRRLTQAASFLLLMALLVIILFPIYWMVLNSVRPESELNSRIPQLWSTNFTLGVIQDLLVNTDFLEQMQNSLIVSLATTVITIVLSALGAYSLTRLNYPGREALSAVVFLAYLIPGALLFLPIYVLLSQIHLNDSLVGLTLVYLTFTVPFGTWMLKGYFATIPLDMEEAGLVDGCTRMGVLVRIVLPLASPGIVAAAVFAFTLALDEFLFAFVLMGAPERFTVPVGLAYFIHGDLYQWGRMMSASTLYSLPALILYVAAQRFLVAGLTGGAIKG